MGSELVAVPDFSLLQHFCRGLLARTSHQLTAEARHRTAITSLRLLTVLNVGFKYARIVQETGCRAARALY